MRKNGNQNKKNQFNLGEENKINFYKNIIETHRKLETKSETTIFFKKRIWQFIREKIQTIALKA